MNYSYMQCEQTYVEEMKPGTKEYILNEWIHLHLVPKQAKLTSRDKGQGRDYFGEGFEPCGVLLVAVTFWF